MYFIEGIVLDHSELLEGQWLTEIQRCTDAEELDFFFTSLPKCRPPIFQSETATVANLSFIIEKYIKEYPNLKREYTLLLNCAKNIRDAKSQLELHAKQLSFFVHMAQNAPSVLTDFFPFIQLRPNLASAISQKTKFNSDSCIEIYENTKMALVNGHIEYKLAHLSCIDALKIIRKFAGHKGQGKPFKLKLQNVGEHEVLSNSSMPPLEGSDSEPEDVGEGMSNNSISTALSASNSVSIGSVEIATSTIASTVSKWTTTLTEGNCPFKSACEHK